LLDKFIIAETGAFRKEMAKPAYRKLYSKIVNFVYPQLRSNPFFGPNIKKLKGEFDDFYRFRMGDFRLFYTVDKDRVIVFIVALHDRKDAYQ
jgi:mRNA interferase RelE/StbE